MHSTYAYKLKIGTQSTWNLDWRQQWITQEEFIVVNGEQFKKKYLIFFSSERKNSHFAVATAVLHAQILAIHEIQIARRIQIENFNASLIILWLKNSNWTTIHAYWKCGVNKKASSILNKAVVRLRMAPRKLFFPIEAEWNFPFVATWQRNLNRKNLKLLFVWWILMGYGECLESMWRI